MGEKGNRRAEAITERLACVSFDGFDPTYPPNRPPSPECCVLAYLTATSIKAGVGSRMGLPPGGRGVTCRPIHSTWQLEVSSET